MAVTASPRLGITRWSADPDPLNRLQFDGDHSILDNLVAIDVQDLLANRPAPGIRGRFFTESSASAGLPGTTWREDGSSWRAVGSRVVAASATDVGQIVRGAASQSADLMQWQDSAGTVKSRMGPGGSGAFFGTTVAIGSVSGVRGALDVINVQGAGSVVATFEGAASQTADLTQWQDSTTAVLAYINSNGRISGNKGVAALGIDPGTGVGLYVAPGSAASVLSMFQAASGQSGDLTQWKDGAGNIAAAVKASGGLWVTPPNNPSIVAGNATNLANGFAFLGQVTTAGTWFSDSAVNEGVVAANIGTGLRMRIGKTSNTAVPAPLSLSNEAAQVVAILKGQASQSGDLTQWQNSAASVLAKVDASGNIASAGFLVDPAATGPLLGMQAATAYMLSRTATNVPLTLKGAASQSGNLQEWRNSAGTLLGKIDPAGRVWGLNDQDLTGGQVSNSGTWTLGTTRTKFHQRGDTVVGWGVYQCGATLGGPGPMYYYLPTAMGGGYAGGEIIGTWRITGSQTANGYLKNNNNFTECVCVVNGVDNGGFTFTPQQFDVLYVNVAYTTA